MKATHHLAVKQRAGGGLTSAAMNGNGARPGPDICPVSELPIPECSCPRCHEQVMLPRAGVGLPAVAGGLRSGDVATPRGFLNGALTKEDAQMLALLEEFEFSTDDSEMVW